jgi:hypothetical protein
MAHGIESFNGSNKIQFGTTVLEGLTIVASSTAAPGGTVSGIDPTKEFLAFNRTTAGFIRGSHNASGTSWTAENNSSSNYGSINWMKVRIASQAGTQNTGYGINVFKSDGSISFSSNFSAGLDVKHVMLPGTLGSSQAQNPSPFTNTTAPMPADIGYTITDSTFANYYFAPGLQLFDITQSGSTVYGGIRQETFKFNSNYTIGVEGLFSYTLFFGYGSSRIRRRQTNASGILVLKKRG